MKLIKLLANKTISSNSQDQALDDVENLRSLRSSPTHQISYFRRVVLLRTQVDAARRCSYVHFFPVWLLNDYSAVPNAFDPSHSIELSVLETVLVVLKVAGRNIDVKQSIWLFQVSLNLLQVLEVFSFRQFGFLLEQVGEAQVFDDGVFVEELLFDEAVDDHLFSEGVFQLDLDFHFLFFLLALQFLKVSDPLFNDSSLLFQFRNVIFKLIYF